MNKARVNFIIQNVIINHKLFIANEVMKILIFITLIIIDISYVFLGIFVVANVINILIFIMFNHLPKFRGGIVETVIHFSYKREELYIVRSLDGKLYACGGNVDIMKTTKYYGRDSFINFSNATVRMGFFVKVKWLEFLLVYVALVVSYLILRLDVGILIVFTFFHFLHILMLCANLVFKKFQMDFNEQNYSYLAAFGGGYGFNKIYFVRAIGLTKFKVLCNTNNKKVALMLQNSLRGCMNYEKEYY